MLCKPSDYHFTLHLLTQLSKGSKHRVNFAKHLARPCKVSRPSADATPGNEHATPAGDVGPPAPGGFTAVEVPSAPEPSKGLEGDTLPSYYGNKLQHMVETMCANPRSLMPSSTLEPGVVSPANLAFYEELRDRAAPSKATLSKLYLRWPYGERLFKRIACLDLLALFVEVVENEMLTMEACIQLKVFVDNYEEISDGKKNYVGDINRWCLWCKFHCLNSILVTPTRAMEFINMESSRPQTRRIGKAGSGKRRLTEKTVGTCSVLHSMNALVHLFEIQRILFPNMVHPRNTFLRMKLNGIRCESKTAMMNIKFDRQRSLNTCVYDGATRKEITLALLDKDDRCKPLRNAALWNLSYATASRSEWAGKVQFRDAFHKKISGHGTMPMHCLIFVKTHFKNWTLDHPFCVGFTRSSDPSVCAVGLLSLVLFEEFHVSGNTINLLDYESWGPLMFFYGKNRYQRLSKGAQALQLSKALKDCNIKGKHVTHLAKKFGLAEMEIHGVPDNQALRLSCFSNSSIADSHYKNQILPLDAVRTLAGFPEKGDYYIPRQELEVPTELLKQVFPGAEAAITAASSSELGNSSIVGFCEMIVSIRPVIFQDSLFYDIKTCNLKVFTHGLFHCDLYNCWRSWALERLKFLRTLHIPRSLVAERTLQIVSDLRSMASNAVAPLVESRSEDAKFVFTPIPDNSSDQPDNNNVSTLKVIGDLSGFQELIDQWKSKIVPQDAVGKKWRTGAINRNQIYRMKQLVGEIESTMITNSCSEAEACSMLQKHCKRHNLSLHMYWKELSKRK